MNWLYTSDQVQKLFGISPNTLSNWVKSGLRLIPGFEQNLFRGDELAWFHQQRALSATRKKTRAEFDCYKCKMRVVPENETIVFVAETQEESTTQTWVRGRCPNCGTGMSKILNKTESNKLRYCVESNTSLLSIDEEDRAVLADVGIKPEIPRPEWNVANELILHAYQFLLGGKAPETATARLAAIRKFENFIGRKSFSKLTGKDLAAYRDHLVSIGLGKNEERRSRSTIRHHASHIRNFLNWLIRQDGYKRMDETLEDYIILPRSQTAKAFQPLPRQVMSDANLDCILKSHPVSSRINRRDRAIIAASFLFGTRSDTTASLRIGDVDIENRVLLVDATLVRVKGHSSMIIYWFPIHEMLANIVTDWVQELYASGAKPDDALFPPDKWLLHKGPHARNSEEVIPTWKTDEPVRRAFRIACKFSGIAYCNPHSAKHYIKSVGEKVCLNPLDRKAWSLNMGHKNELTSDLFYNKMADQRRGQIFKKLQAGDLTSEDDKDLLIAYYEQRLSPGTLEHTRALNLQIERMNRYREQPQSR